MTKRTPIKLTISKIEKMNPGDELWDSIITGLLVRAGKRHKSFMYYYKNASGKERRPKIGNYGSLTVEMARAIARTWAMEVAEGKDPSLTRHQKRKANAPATLSDLREKWKNEISKAQKRKATLLLETQNKNLTSSQKLKILKEKKRDFANLKPSTIRDYNYIWNKLIKKYGSKTEINSILKEEIESYHNELGDKSIYTANRTLAFVSIIMNLAIGWKMRDQSLGNPTQGITKFKEYSRKRYLTPEEAPRFLKVASEWMKSDETHKRSISRLAWLCLFNGARRGEFMSAKLSWINWSHGILCLPDSKTGKKDIILSAESLQVLVQRYEEWELEGSISDCDWVIPGKYPNMHLKEPKKGWKIFLEEAKISDLRLHDLRHSFASMGLSGGAGGLDQIGQVLGHSNPNTTLRYSHLTEASSRNIANLTGQHILKMMEGQHIYQNSIIPESINRKRKKVAEL